MPSENKGNKVSGMSKESLKLAKLFDEVLKMKGNYLHRHNKNNKYYPSRMTCVSCENLKIINKVLELMKDAK